MQKKVDCFTFVNLLRIVNSHIFLHRIEGPKTSDPSKYIRYIYNRVILENATVRASVVSTLAKFGAMVDLFKPRIFILLRRCLYDSDDEEVSAAISGANVYGKLKFDSGIHIVQVREVRMPGKSIEVENLEDNIAEVLQEVSMGTWLV